MSESEISSDEPERRDPEKAAAEETPRYDPTTTERLLDAYRWQYAALMVTVREFLRLDEALAVVDEDDSEEAQELRDQHGGVLRALLELIEEP